MILYKASLYMSRISYIFTSVQHWSPNLTVQNWLKRIQEEFSYLDSDFAVITNDVVSSRCKNYIWSKCGLWVCKETGKSFHLYSRNGSPSPLPLLGSVSFCKSSGVLIALVSESTTTEWLWFILLSLWSTGSSLRVVLCEATYDMPYFCAWDSPGQSPCRIF